jgi:hypothetical protein
MIGKKFMVAKYKKGKDIGEVLDEAYSLLFEPSIGSGAIIYDRNGRGLFTSNIQCIITTTTEDSFSIELQTLNSTYVLCEVR